MKRLKNELNALVNRGVDRHLRLAVTGLSRSGKTAFITAMVNQLLNIHAGARLPLLSAVREERLLGVKRIPQRDFGIPRFTYDEGLAQLYGDPPAWPTPTRGVSEIRLALRFKSNDSLLRHFKDTSTLYLEIVDYPGEWLLDLPMLAQDYLSWSRQMTGLLNGQRGEWSVKWRMMCEGLDPLAPADENRLEDIAAAMGQKGTMSALRRTSAGVYTEADAHTLEEILAAKEQGMDALEALMLPVESVFESLPLLVVEPWVEQHLYNGCPTSRYPAADGRYRVRNAAGQFLGLANIVQGVLRVEKLFVERN